MRPAPHRYRFLTCAKRPKRRRKPLSRWPTLCHSHKAGPRATCGLWEANERRRSMAKVLALVVAAALVAGGLTVGVAPTLTLLAIAATAAMFVTLIRISRI